MFAEVNLYNLIDVMEEVLCLVCQYFWTVCTILPDHVFAHL